MNEAKVFDIWGDLLLEAERGERVVAYGVFDAHGVLLYANALMVHLLDADSSLVCKNSLVNPDFSRLQNLGVSDGRIFEGVATIGDMAHVSYTLESEVYVNAGSYLLLAYADVVKLFQENEQMSHLNQEVNNLQRQLIKEKSKLQVTLDELKETQEMLVQSEKMNAMGQLVAGVAHEINNPIGFVTNNLFEIEKYSQELVAIVEGAFGFLRDELSPEQIARLKAEINLDESDYIIEDITATVADAKKGVGRVKTIVEDLRRFSRLDESDVKCVDLVASIRSIFAFVNSEIKQKSIVFNVEMPDVLMVECFPGQLNQAVLNILLNAIQAVCEGGIVGLTIVDHDDTIDIQLSDNGVGILSEDLKKIFDPFYTTKPVGEGTGLGLSITYKIINELHRGDIVVDSIKGEGSVFTITIPKKNGL